jgi:cytochrome P450 RapN
MTDRLREQGDRLVAKTDAREIVDYPFVRHDDLSMDPVYRDIQGKPPFRAQLDYGEPIWILTRYHDVKTAYGDRRFGKALGLGRDRPRMHEMAVPDDPTMLVNMDPPDQTRVRRLTASAFSPAQIRGMTGWIEGMTAALLDDIEAAGRGADYMSLFAWRLPLQVITGILGAPQDEIPLFRRWVDEMTGVDSTREQRASAHHELTAHLRELIAERRAHATDDLLSVLVQARDDDDRLSEDELVSLSMTLFLGGFETTAAQLGSTVWTLMAHRHLWEELQADPDLLPAAMEELRRWIPSFRHGGPMIRWANEDVELSSGLVIPAGDPVLPEHHVANRDETVFPHGWELDFHREAPEPHLSLAWGAHRCMGAHLANLEIEVALKALLARFPALDLAVAPQDVTWSPSTFLRSAAALPLTW